MSHLISIYVDADACPVKAEVYRVAERHALKGLALKVLVVTNSAIAVPRDPMIERVIVGAGMDAADDWIAERAKRGDIVITADVPLAARSIKAGAQAIAPSGLAFTPGLVAPPGTVKASLWPSTRTGASRETFSGAPRIYSSATMSPTTSRRLSANWPTSRASRSR